MITMTCLMGVRVWDAASVSSSRAAMAGTIIWLTSATTMAAAECLRVRWNMFSPFAEGLIDAVVTTAEVTRTARRPNRAFVNWMQTAATGCQAWRSVTIIFRVPVASVRYNQSMGLSRRWVVCVTVMLLG